MIRTEYLVPEIYTRESRSFQLFGHLYDLIANYSKMCIDSMENNPISKNTDYKLLDLMTSTIGFESKHNYNVADLFALCLSFETIIKYKGSKTAIEYACNVLLNSQGIDVEAIVDYSGNPDYLVSIYIPSTLTDIILLEDLFDYILPAGFNYEFVVIEEKNIGTTELTTNDSITAQRYTDGIGDDSVGTISKGTGEAITIDDNFSESTNGSGYTYTSIVSTPNELKES